jgi:hypothetical protein
MMADGHELYLESICPVITIAAIVTPWNRVLLETLTVAQLVKKNTNFYVTQRFITVLTTAPHWTIS